MMRTSNFTRIDQVAAWRLCIGCGACLSVCSQGAISLIDIPDRGIQPVVDEGKCQQCSDCVKTCPGIGLEHEPFSNNSIEELKPVWGSVVEIWEGFATDDRIRYTGSSGGIATALALYGLERKIVGGILHVGVDANNPIKNIPVYSRTREQLLACNGSRYSPASPCEALGIIKKQNHKSIFIGKPCDVAALSKVRRFDAELNEKIAFTISIFCAGTPTTEGTLAVLRRMGVSNVSELESLRYRGNGWPGSTTAVKKNGETCKMEYAQSWGNILSKYGQLRCRLCPDTTGEFADISCGDPWHREIETNDPGRSLILVRTETGQQNFQNALRANYIRIKRTKSTALPLSQKSLLERRCHLWGRLAAMRMILIPVPRFVGFSLFTNWLKLPFPEKLCSFAGTFKRIISRNLYKPFGKFRK